jgi:hypothetical protein
MSGPRCTHCGATVTRKIHPRTQHPFCDATCYGAWQRGRTFSEQGKPARPRRGCGVDGCAAVHFGRGYCRKHYLRLVYAPPKRQTPRTTVEPIACSHCHADFLPRHKGAKYCSIACSASARKAPFIVKKGYKKLLMPSHPRADTKGYVFEHIVVAETTLGRPLRAGEEVHHKDFDRQNNSPENLQVCANHAEHMRLHRLTSSRRAKSNNGSHRDAAGPANP